VENGVRVSTPIVAVKRLKCGLKGWEFVDSSNPGSLSRPVGHAPDHLTQKSR